MQARRLREWLGVQGDDVLFAFLAMSSMAAIPLAVQETAAPAASMFEQAHALVEAHQLQKANELLSELVRQDQSTRGR